MTTPFEPMMVPETGPLIIISGIGVPMVPGDDSTMVPGGMELMTVPGIVRMTVPGIIGVTMVPGIGLTIVPGGELTIVPFDGIGVGIMGTISGWRGWAMTDGCPPTESTCGSTDGEPIGNGRAVSSF